MGLIPANPQREEGIRIDPPPSEPIATGTRPLPTITPAPELLPPVGVKEMYERERERERGRMKKRGVKKRKEKRKGVRDIVPDM